MDRHRVSTGVANELSGTAHRPGRRGMHIPVARVAAVAVVALGLMGAAQVSAAAVPTATLSTAGTGVRVAVAITGTPLPRRVSVTAGTVTVVLSGARRSWRSSVLTGRRAKAFQTRTGKRIAVRMTVGARTRSATATLAAPATDPAAPTTPGGGGATTPGGGTAALPGAPSGGLTGQAAIDRFSQYLAGSRMVNVTAAANLSSQSTTRFSFCQSGAAFIYYRESIGTYTSSVENAQAAYRVTNAAFNADNTLGEGLVEYSGASPANTSLGPSGQAIIRLGSGIAWINSLSAEYQWQTGAAGC